jgi:hypothetical protein
MPAKTSTRSAVFIKGDPVLGSKVKIKGAKITDRAIAQRPGRIDVDLKKSPIHLKLEAIETPLIKVSVTATVTENGRLCQIAFIITEKGRIMVESVA